MTLLQFGNRIGGGCFRIGSWGKNRNSDWADGPIIILDKSPHKNQHAKNLFLNEWPRRPMVLCLRWVKRGVANDGTGVVNPIEVAAAVAEF